MHLNKKFLLKLFILLIILFFTDQTIGHILQSWYFKAKYNKNYQINYIADKVNDDVLIFGSSRASHHYVPSILSDSLHMSVYNCGINAKSIYYYYGLLMLIKDRYLPKLIILDLSYSDFCESVFTIEGVKDLAPYYGRNKDLDSLIYQIAPLEKYKMISMCYRYNSRIVDIFGDNFRKTDENWENGYEPLFGQIKSIADDKTYRDGGIIEPRKVYYLEKFVAFCKQNNVKIVLCVSPVCYMCENYDDFTPVEDVANKYHVPLFNHWCDPFFTKNERLFKDGIHLNHTGSIEYSSIIANEIQIYLNKYE